MTVRRRASQAAQCPEMVLGHGETRGCKRYTERLCELEERHPICEEWLKRNPDTPLPGDERYDLAREYLARNPRYRADVIARIHFRDGWQMRVESEEFEVADTRSEDSPKGDIANPVPRVRVGSAEALPGMSADDDRATVRVLTQEQIESWRDLNTEICIESQSIGRLWIVPSYTGQERNEISIDDTAALLRMLTAFPGSRVDGFIRKPRKPGNPES